VFELDEGNIELALLQPI